MRVSEDTRLPPLADTDNNDAIALERSTFLNESRVCSSGLVPGTSVTTAVSSIVDRSTRMYLGSVNRPASPSVLRV